MTQSSAVHEGRPPPTNAILAALERIERRLDHLEQRIERIDALTSQAPGALAAATDTFDDIVGNLHDKGVDVDARLRAIVALTERLTQPSVLEALERAADLAAQAPGMVAATADTVDSLIARMNDRGIDVDARMKTTLAIAERLTSPMALEAVSEVLDHLEDLRYLLHSGVLDKHAVRLVGELGKALAATSAEQAPQVGAFGAFRALSDPNVQRAVGFTLQLAARFGASLETTSRALPKGNS